VTTSGAVTILAIETATLSVGAALANENGLLAAFEVRAGRRHAELLHGVVMSVLEVTGLGFGDLDCIAVDVGPGLFTGIRVGVAAAKGFAVALGVPVVGLTSLEILASACRATGDHDAVGVVDLRRGEVAWAMPSAEDAPGVSRHGPPELLAAELAERLAAGAGGGTAGGAGAASSGRERPVLAGESALSGGRERSVLAGESALSGGREPIVLAGDGAIRYAEILTAGRYGRVLVAGPELAAPPVASLAVRGMTELAAGRAVDPLAVRPTYLREADVRINWTTRHDAPAAGRGEVKA
jgi:tRNA threonylcarbamoyladenosine biosynthesis protein TsaB